MIIVIWMIWLENWDEEIEEDRSMWSDHYEVPNKFPHYYLENKFK